MEQKSKSANTYGGSKGSITNQFIIAQNNSTKYKLVYQNTEQFSKTQINSPKHKSVYQNTKQFLKTQTNLPKHKSVYQNTNQFLKTETNFAKHKSKAWKRLIPKIFRAQHGDCFNMWLIDNSSSLWW